MQTNINAADINDTNISQTLKDVPNWTFKHLATTSWELREKPKLMGALLYAWATHGQLSGDAVERMAGQAFKDVMQRATHGVHPEKLIEFVGGEIFVTTPEVTKKRGYGNGWMVCYEAGPSNWGVGETWNYNNREVLCETYWGFDLLLTAH